MIRRFHAPSQGAWPTVLGALVSLTAVGLGLRFGFAGLAGTLAIGLFALFVSAAIIAGRRGVQPAPTTPEGAAAGPAGPQDRGAPRAS